MKIGYRVCYLILILLLFGCEKESSRFGRFIDKRDGKIYRTVKIGEQVWMAENLAYRADTGCLAYEEDESNMKIYGYLYNWETACEVCPEGWILPSDDDWKILEEFIGMSSEELDLQGPTYRGEGLAGLLKVVGHSDWEKNNEDATNSTGFSALPAGSIYYPYPWDYMFFGKGEWTVWWTSTDSYNYGYYSRVIKSTHDTNGIYRFRSNYNTDFYSVRCIKDVN
ncbi:MAG TPA: hypothetical protein DDX98_07385 [Bacteroidales bacterium]|jgi:uncharacterized protein (TIGR02145 family)|nr:hypothetical protein [Bacteroidales bacterium]